MTNHRPLIRKLAITGVAILSTLSPAATLGAGAESSETLTWLRVNTCSRADRSAGYVDIEGECLRHDPAFGHDVTICATHFCAAQPGEPRARIIHPTDFGPTS